MPESSGPEKAAEAVGGAHLSSARERAQILIDAWDETGEPLEFVENAEGTCVHVVARPPAPPPGADEHPDVEPGRRRTWGEVLGEDVIDVVMGVLVAVCGVRVRRNRGGLDEGGRLTDWFADQLLCARCHRAFGDRADLIFECNQPPR